MRIYVIAAMAALMVSTAACNKADNETADTNMADDAMLNDGMSADANMMGNDMMAAPMAASDFVMAAAGTDMYEIESGKLASTKATSQGLKDFAAMIVTDHTKSSADLKAAAAASTPPVMVPTTMPAEHQAHLDSLKAATGADFDRLFIQQQTDGHQKALDMLKAYAASGDSESLKTFATNTAPVIEKHLTQIKSMKM